MTTVIAGARGPVCGGGDATVRAARMAVNIFCALPAEELLEACLFEKLAHISGYLHCAFQIVIVLETDLWRLKICKSSRWKQHLKNFMSIQQNSKDTWDVQKYVNTYGGLHGVVALVLLGKSRCGPWLHNGVDAVDGAAVVFEDVFEDMEVGAGGSVEHAAGGVVGAGEEALGCVDGEGDGVDGSDVDVEDSEEGVPVEGKRSVWPRSSQEVFAQSFFL
jgi:hypothetical protein